MYCTFFAIVEIGGMLFMVKMLLNNLGYGESDGKPAIALDPSLPIDNSDIEFNWIPFMLACIQIINQWLYAIVNPLKFRPLGCDLTACDVGTTAFYEPVSLPGAQGTFRVVVAGRSFVRASALAMMLVGATAFLLNMATLGSTAISDFSLRDHLSVSPGSVVGAVGWVVCVVLLALHILVVCVYEHMKNSHDSSVIAVQVSGAVTILAALCAHAATIPGVKEGYAWYPGTAFFQVSLLVWVASNLSLVHFQGRPTPGESSAKTKDVYVSLALIASLGLSIRYGLTHKGVLWADSLWIVLLFVWSFTDPRDVHIRVDNIRVATNSEVVELMDTQFFFGVPWFMCDLHGMKDVLKGNAKAEDHTA